MPNDHPTLPVRCNLFRRGEDIDIDAKLAPLMKEVWRLGIWTSQCCQESEPGLASVSFMELQDAMAFLLVCQKPYRPSLEVWDEGEDGTHSIVMSLNVLFPVADLEEITARFQEARKPRSWFTARPETFSRMKRKAR
jgi:hypothetical protein